MKLEKALEKIVKVRKQYHERHFEERIVFSGIKTLDEAISGFNSQKIYTIIARPGNRLYAFASSIANNIDVLYQTNYSILLQKFDADEKIPFDYWSFLNGSKKFVSGKDVISYNSIEKPQSIQKPILLIGNIDNLNDNEVKNLIAKIRKWWHEEVLVIFLYSLDDDKPEQIFISDIPNQVYVNSDVIISLYRPEYYKVNTWNDRTSTTDQIKFETLKNDNKKFANGILTIDYKSRRVSSLNDTFK